MKDLGVVEVDRRRMGVGIDGRSGATMACFDNMSFVSPSPWDTGFSWPKELDSWGMRSKIPVEVRS